MRTCALLLLTALLTPQLCAQATGGPTTIGLRAGFTAPELPGGDRAGLAQLRESLRVEARRTYWLEGAIIAGVPVTVLSYALFRAFHRSTSQSLVAGLMLGSVGGGVGAVIGGMFDKPERAGGAPEESRALQD